VINITGCRGARLLVWLILNDRVQPSFIAGVSSVQTDLQIQPPLLPCATRQRDGLSCIMCVHAIQRASGCHTGDIRRVIRSAGNLCL